MGEKNLDKKMTNSVSYVKVWAAVAGKIVGRKDFRFGFHPSGRFV